MTQQHQSLCAIHVQSGPDSGRRTNNTGTPGGHVTTGAKFVCFLNSQCVSFMSLIVCGLLPLVRPRCAQQNAAVVFFSFFSPLGSEELFFQRGLYNWRWWFVVEGDTDKEVALPLLQLLTASCVTGNCHVLELVLWVWCLHTIFTSLIFFPFFFTFLIIIFCKRSVASIFSMYLFKNKEDEGEFV